MNSQLLLANILRWIARLISIPLIPLIAIYLLFVGLQLLAEPGPLVLSLYLLLLILMATGLVIAWWREGLGATVALASLVGFLVLSWVLPGFRAMLGRSLLLGPLNLLLALAASKGTDQNSLPNSVYVASCALTAPVWLFLASWLLRRKPQVKAS